MNEASHTYAIEFLRRDPERNGERIGERIGAQPIEPDWLPAREWAWLRRLRSRGADALASPPGSMAIEPVWDAEAGAPVVEALRIVSGTSTDRETADPAWALELAATPYFSAAAREASAALVERGLLVKGERVPYRVVAYARDATGAIPGGWAVEESSAPLPLEERSLDAFVARSIESQPGADDEHAVFIPEHVLAQCRAHAKSAGTVETGGIFVGRLHRSACEPALLLEITAMIPAPHTETTSTSLTFTPESWSAVDDAIALRRSDEVACGWFHSHPRFCRNCPPEAQRVCQFSNPFFSNDDVHMHRTIFPRAFQVALLVSDLGEAEHDASFFGWREGRVASRGYHVLGDR